MPLRENLIHTPVRGWDRGMPGAGRGSTRRQVLTMLPRSSSRVSASTWASPRT